MNNNRVVQKCLRVVDKFLLAHIRKEPVPGVVYHYTSPGGLLGIVQSGTLRATDIRYLNDSEEYKHGLRIITAVLGEYEKRVTSDFEAMFCNDIASELQDGYSDLPVYITSLSADGDLLSQWRAYCPASGGFAIGFETGALMRAARCLLLPCVYEEEKQVALAGQLVEFGLDLLRARHRDTATPLGSEGASVRDEPSGLSLFFGAIQMAAAFKHAGFSEEREWRLIEEHGYDSQKVRFREGRSGIVPYVELDWFKCEPDTALGRLMVGPSPHEGLAVEAVQMLMAWRGIPFDRIKTSALPYRTW